MPIRGIENLPIVGGEVCLDFINTVHQYDKEPENDELASYGHLLDWALKVDLVDKASHQYFQKYAMEKTDKAASSLEQIKQIRYDMYCVFIALAQAQLPEQARLKNLCDFWKKAICQASFTPSSDGGYWTFHQDCSDLVSLIYPVINNAMRLLESQDVRRIRLCEACDCSWLFIDQSKNRSRRWCQMGVCGNREKAKRHYEKIRSADRSHLPG